MKLSISNIAWENKYDEEIYSFLKSVGVEAIEIAPTKIFGENPYSQIERAKKWATEIRRDFGLQISSMQSIWYGVTENIFGADAERKKLIEYTKEAVLFAQAIGCKNIVFGCPKNRDTENTSEKIGIACDFFHEIGEFAFAHGTCISLEANPVIYNTRFMNCTKEAVEVAKKCQSFGIKINYDLGAAIYNGEKLEDIYEFRDLINHVHISEPNLKLIRNDEKLHRKLFDILRTANYENYVSIEMGTQHIDDVKHTVEYVQTL